jgi:hypothetical protein
VAERRALYPTRWVPFPRAHLFFFYLGLFFSFFTFFQRENCIGSYVYFNVSVCFCLFLFLSFLSFLTFLSLLFLSYLSFPFLSFITLYGFFHLLFLYDDDFIGRQMTWVLLDTSEETESSNYKVSFCIVFILFISLGCSKSWNIGV